MVLATWCYSTFTLLLSFDHNAQVSSNSSGNEIPLQYWGFTHILSIEVSRMFGGLIWPATFIKLTLITEKARSITNAWPTNELVSRTCSWATTADVSASPTSVYRQCSCRVRMQLRNHGSRSSCVGTTQLSTSEVKETTYLRIILTLMRLQAAKVFTRQFSKQVCLFRCLSSNCLLPRARLNDWPLCSTRTSISCLKESVLGLSNWSTISSCTYGQATDNISIKRILC